MLSLHLTRVKILEGLLTTFNFHNTTCIRPQSTQLITPYVDDWWDLFSPQRPTIYQLLYKLRCRYAWISVDRPRSAIDLPHSITTHTLPWFFTSVVRYPYTKSCSATRNCQRSNIPSSIYRVLNLSTQKIWCVRRDLNSQPTD